MKRWKTLQISVVLLAAGLNAGAACGAREQVDQDTAEDPEQVDDAMSTVTAETGLLLGLSEDVDEGAAAVDVAAAAATNTPLRFSPEGCVTAAASGAVVTYTLNDCLGPYGVGTWKGDVEVTYARQDGGGVILDAVGKGLSLNQRPFSMTVASVYTIDGTTQSLAVSAQSNWTTEADRRIARNGNYTLSWEAASQCFALTGTWDTTVGARTWETSVANYSKCPGECPADGGTISYNRAGDTASLTLQYDGDETALWINGRGQSGDVTVRCD